MANRAAPRKAPPDSGPQFTIDEQAYQVAKAKLGEKFDIEVARRMGVHPITWTRVRGGKYPLTERVRAAIRSVFPDDYDSIVRQEW